MGKNADRFFLSMIVGWGREFRFVLEQAGQAVDKSVWYMDPQTVNAYYNPLFNEMVFPAAILQPPFYHARYPDALNYGGIGSVMGHELTHGFDDEGRLFDAQGRLHPWWTNASAEAFDELTQCPINTYSDFPLDYPGHINGEFVFSLSLSFQSHILSSPTHQHFFFKDKLSERTLPTWVESRTPISPSRPSMSSTAPIQCINWLKKCLECQTTNSSLYHTAKCGVAS